MWSLSSPSESRKRSRAESIRVSFHFELTQGFFRSRCFTQDIINAKFTNLDYCLDVCEEVEKEVSSCRFLLLERESRSSVAFSLTHAVFFLTVPSLGEEGLVGCLSLQGT